MAAPGKTQRPTMKDVARLAGVSIQTVSMVVNDKAVVSPETRDRILAAIDELGYRPQAVGRSLRTGSTRTIGLFVSDITNPFFARMADAVEDHAHRAGYNLILYNTHSDPERERTLPSHRRRALGGRHALRDDHGHAARPRRAASGRHPDGGHRPHPARLRRRLRHPRQPPHRVLSSPSISSTSAIGIWATSAARWTCASRSSAWSPSSRRSASAASSPSRTPSATPVGAASPATARCDTLLEASRTPTAVFASNDRLAIGAMRAAVEAGLRVPYDVSIVGVDDIELAPYLTPPLTTVRQSLAGRGHAGHDRSCSTSSMAASRSRPRSSSNRSWSSVTPRPARRPTASHALEGGGEGIELTQRAPTHPCRSLAHPELTPGCQPHEGDKDATHSAHRDRARGRLPGPEHRRRPGAGRRDLREEGPVQDRLLRLRHDAAVLAGVRPRRPGGL